MNTECLLTLILVLVTVITTCIIGLTYFAHKILSEMKDIRRIINDELK